MLEEVQLLIAGWESKVIAGGTFAAFLRTKRWIGQDNIIALQLFSEVGKGVTEINGTADIVQHGVHQGQSVGIMHQFTAGKSPSTLKLLLIYRQLKQVVSVFFHITVGCNHKTECATGRVIAPLTGLGSNELRHNVDKDTGCKILPGTGLLFICILFQQTFIQIAEALFFGGIPVKLVDGLDNLLQIFGFIDVALGALIDLTDTAGAGFSQMFQQCLVELLQLYALFRKKLVPAILLRDSSFRTGFLTHFQEQDISQFCNILMISDTVIPQHIAEIPEFRYDFLIVHAIFPPSS